MYLRMCMHDGDLPSKVPFMIWVLGTPGSHAGVWGGADSCRLPMLVFFPIRACLCRGPSRGCKRIRSAVPPISVRTYSYSAFLWASSYSCATIPMGLFLWAYSCATISMGLFLWTSSHVLIPMGQFPWASSYGPIPMDLFLWDLPSWPILVANKHSDWGLSPV